MPNFICPNCGNRSVSTERTAGFQNRARGCTKCGFGFLFELLDDYYPAPNAAFFVCDQQGRLIGTGPRRARADRPGRPRRDRPAGAGGARPRVRERRRPHRHRARVGRAGARQAVTVHAEGDRPEPAKADIFPAYDDDGGLLLVLTPRL